MEKKIIFNSTYKYIRLTVFHSIKLLIKSIFFSTPNQIVISKVWWVVGIFIISFAVVCIFYLLFFFYLIWFYSIFLHFCNTSMCVFFFNDFIVIFFSIGFGFQFRFLLVSKSASAFSSSRPGTFKCMNFCRFLCSFIC